MAAKPLPLEDRFWPKVAKSGPDDCWDWTGRLDRDGYGRITENQKPMLAHRASYLIAHGELDPSLNVCHTCDRPRCVNPRHLFLGTQKDNVIDMHSKGRHPTVPITHCPRGHEYTESNTVYDSGRRCRVCKNERARKYYASRKALATKRAGE